MASPSYRLGVCNLATPLMTQDFKFGGYIYRANPNNSPLKILGTKYNWVTTLTFLGHVTSLVTWLFDSPYPISYWCSIVTKPLSPALLEILGSTENWVTTLTFLGRVTSSVTWLFDSPHPISYSCCDQARDYIDKPILRYRSPTTHRYDIVWQTAPTILCGHHHLSVSTRRNVCAVCLYRL